MARHFCMNNGWTSMFTLNTSYLHCRWNKSKWITAITLKVHFHILPFWSENHFIFLYFTAIINRAWSVCLVKTSNLPEKCPTTDTCLQACWVIFVLLLITIKSNKILSVFLHLLTTLWISFRWFQRIPVNINILPPMYKWNSLKLPETHSEHHQEMQEDTGSILLNFVKMRLKSDCSKLTI